MKIFVCLGLWFVSLVLGQSLHAVGMVPLAIEELTQKAKLIVQGTVLSKTCLRDEQGRIFTKIELQVSEVWKGTFSGRHLMVVHGGGTLGEQRSIISGQAEYQPGEEIVGFFVMNDRHEAVTLGLAQGKFHVWRDERSGAKLAANPFHGTGPGSTPSTAPQHQNFGRERLQVDQLKRQVQGAAR